MVKSMILASLATLACIGTVNARHTAKVEVEFFSGPQCNGSKPQKKTFHPNECVNKINPYRSLHFKTHKDHFMDRVCRLTAYTDAKCKGNSYELNEDLRPTADWSACKDNIDAFALQAGKTNAVNFRSMRMTCDGDAEIETAEYVDIPTATTKYEVSLFLGGTVSQSQTANATGLMSTVARGESAVILEGTTMHVKVPGTTYVDPVTTVIPHLPAMTTSVSTQVVEVPGQTYVNPTTTIISQLPDVTVTSSTSTTTTVSTDDTLVVGISTVYSTLADVTIESTTETTTTVSAEATVSATISVADAATVTDITTTFVTSGSATLAPQFTLTASKRLHARDVTKAKSSASATLAENEVTHILGDLANQMGDWVQDMDDDLQEAKEDVENQAKKAGNV